MKLRPYQSIFLKESQISASDYAEDLGKAISSIFPKSLVQVQAGKSLGDPHVYILFAVGKDKSNWVNGILQNDISLTKAFIYGITPEGMMADRIEFDPFQGGGILVKPDPGSYMAFGNVKVGLRKKTGSPEQVFKHIVNYFTKLRTALKANYDQIPDEQKELLKGII
jgi:hypothetical protein